MIKVNRQKTPGVKNLSTRMSNLIAAGRSRGKFVDRYHRIRLVILTIKDKRIYKRTVLTSNKNVCLQFTYR